MAWNLTNAQLNKCQGEKDNSNSDRVRVRVRIRVRIRVQVKVQVKVKLRVTVNTRGLYARIIHGHGQCHARIIQDYTEIAFNPNGSPLSGNKWEIVLTSFTSFLFVSPASNKDYMRT